MVSIVQIYPRVFKKQEKTSQQNRVHRVVTPYVRSERYHVTQENHSLLSQLAAQSSILFLSPRNLLQTQRSFFLFRLLVVSWTAFVKL